MKALKSRIQDDVIGICGKGSNQHNSITLNIPYNADPHKLLQLKIEFRQILQGWINYIKKIHLIEEEKIQLSEQEYKVKYGALQIKWNDLVPEYEDLLKNHETLQGQYDDALTEIKILKDKLNEESNIGDIIKILFLGASPVDELRLRIDEEQRDIEKGLRMATLRDQFELKAQWAVTAKTLQQAILDEDPTIVHFSGHGDTKGIAVEDSLGNSIIIGNDAIGQPLRIILRGNQVCVTQFLLS
ncbi:MAG: hypothetical protein ABIT05_12640 [Chitinophagaceae bacterium]